MGVPGRKVAARGGDVRVATRVLAVARLLRSFVERRPLVGRPLHGQAMRVAGSRHPGRGPIRGARWSEGRVCPPRAAGFRPDARAEPHDVGF